MKNYAYVCLKDVSTGEIEGYITSQGESVVPSERVLQVDYDESIKVFSPEFASEYWFRDGKIKPLPVKPGEFFKFNYVSGAWVPDAQKADSTARAKRSQLLAACDWTQMPDVPLATKSAWATYRQALRDVTDQQGYPFSIEWPVPPP